MRKMWMAVGIGAVITLLVVGFLSFNSGVTQNDAKPETAASTTTKTAIEGQAITKSTSQTIGQRTNSTVTQTSTVSQINRTNNANSPLGGVLQVQVKVAKAIITRGSEQTIYITVTSNGAVIEDAGISGVITYASGSTRSFSGSTTTGGTYEYSWQIGGNSNPGTFSVSITASKSGYTQSQSSTAFTVKTKSG